jgi:hypothetical protein
MHETKGNVTHTVGYSTSPLRRITCPDTETEYNQRSSVGHLRVQSAYFGLKDFRVIQQSCIFFTCPVRYVKYCTNIFAIARHFSDTSPPSWYLSLFRD